MAELKCVHCGSDEIAPGRVQSTGAIYFRPEKVGFFSLKTADVRLEASMCLNCGVVTLTGDASKAKSLIK